MLTSRGHYFDHSKHNPWVYGVQLIAIFRFIFYHPNCAGLGAAAFSFDHSVLFAK